MLSRLRPNLTFANVASGLSPFLVLADGTAWALNEWTGANIVDGSLTSADYKNNDIRSGLQGDCKRWLAADRQQVVRRARDRGFLGPAHRGKASV